ncbi:tyrosine-protein phosphatase [Candidatus Borkfalkia ceftriaxoniphila]|nr:tyrosine-protein phosphatase [Candidatus Borkfalkia ceftriaxoniphila]
MAVNPKNGGMATLANPQVKAFIAEYVPFSSQFFNKEAVDCFANAPDVISWKCKEIATYYTVRISEYEDMRKVDSYLVNETQLSLPAEYFHLGKKYFWDVTAPAGTAFIRSEMFSFTVDHAPRSVSIDGVSNTRDLGGKIGLGGKLVKQDKVYRGAKLDDISETGRERAKNVYKIRTDLDLRNSSESMGAVLNGVTYLNYSAPYYVGDGTGLDDGGAQFEKALADALRVFSNEQNYPIYMHCSIGRDRTGTVALLLYGLLGVSERDIYIDYEMSFFSSAGRNQANINHLVGKLRSTIGYLKSFGEGDLYTGCENYVKSVGLSEDEISAIRSLLLA